MQLTIPCCRTSALLPYTGEVGTANAPSRWLYGPRIDLLFGCGVLYAAFFSVHALAGDRLQAAIPLALTPILALITGGAHYGATLLRVYERPEDRRRYATLSIWVSGLIFGLCYASLHAPLLGSALLTLYLAWSPWHYAGQNYGLALMFLRRRGVAIDPVFRRAFHASFVLSVALSILAVQGADLYGDNQPPGAFAVAEPEIERLRLGLSRTLQSTLMVILLALYGLALGVAALRLPWRGRTGDLLPAFALVATQSLWFVVPAAAIFFELHGGVAPLVPDQFAYAFFWIATGHALQYLWVTSYYARQSSGYPGLPGYYAKCLLAGGAIWGIPALLFAPSVLGTDITYTSGLFAIVATGVNLHHFVLDGAIWKLRDGRVARILLRETPVETTEPIGPPRRRWLAPALLGAGAIGALSIVVGTWEHAVGYKQAKRSDDWVRVQAAGKRLSWVGRADEVLHFELARHAVARKELDWAIHEANRSIEIRPHANTWYLLGNLYELAERWSDAADAYEEAHALSPSNLATLQRLPRVLNRLGRSDEALAVLEQAVAQHPDDPELAAELRRTRAELGDRSSS